MHGQAAQGGGNAGLSDMADPLLQYLTKHQPLFHVGAKHDFEQIPRSGAR